MDWPCSCDDTDFAFLLCARMGLVVGQCCRKTGPSVPMPAQVIAVCQGVSCFWCVCMCVHACVFVSGGGIGLEQVGG